MKQNNFWLRALNLRSDEGWLVKKLFMLQFLQGAGIAFFFTAAFALFLVRFPITEMPYVFIYSSLLLWISGFIYSRLEHKLNISKLAIITTIFMAVSMLLFRLAFDYVKTGWFLYWMLAWFNVLYLLNNLEFWGIASLLFDTRQSKRVFGVISSGDIPAKFIGYTLALLTVEYIGTINLLWAGALCMLGSIPFLVSIKRSGKLLEVQHKPHPKHTRHHVGKIMKNFSGNKLIRRLAFLGIIITGSFIIINFAFYAGVKESYQDDVALAQFIAMFLAIVRIIALVIKTIFTSRLINKLGIIKSLLITPVVMLILITGIVLTQNMDSFHTIILYLFGATSIVVDILRSSINSPVFLTIMQPLSNHERLRAHMIVKGIMDPFASLIAGVILLLLIRYEQKVDFLLSLSYVLLGICVLWIIGIYRVNNQYLRTIIKTISSRYFNQENFSISDSGTLSWLKEKVKSGSETEVINILNMLQTNRNALSDEFLRTVLEHPSDKVKITALKLMQQQELPGSTDFLIPFLQQNNNPLIIAELINVMCRNAVDSNLLEPYLDHKEPVIMKAALTGLFFCGSGESKKRATFILEQMILSENVTERMLVAEILSSRENCPETSMILQLMNDENTTIRRTAFLAAGRSRNKEMISELMNRLSQDEVEIMQALFVAGDISLPYILEAIKSKKLSRLQKEKLILLCGRIGGVGADMLLFDLLTELPEEYMTVIKAMYRSNYIPRAAEQDVFISIAKKMLSRAAGIIYMQNSLEQREEKYRLLINSFNLELNSLRESLLFVFALMYDRENINKVRTAYATGKKESIMNAMEIIDITVRKDLGRHFNVIFEPGNISERMHGIRKHYPVEFFDDVERVLIRVLAEETRPYNNWTMSCSLYTSKKQQHTIDHAIIKKYTTAENLLLRETAMFAL